MCRMHAVWCYAWGGSPTRAANEGDTDRYVLLIRFWHPDVTSTEREALQYIFDALDGPQALVDLDFDYFSQVCSLCVSTGVISIFLSSDLLCPSCPVGAWQIAERQLASRSPAPSEDINA